MILIPEVCELAGILWVYASMVIKLTCGCAFFTLDSPPSITSVVKTPANFKQGGTLELHCQATATGSSLITYKWFATDFEGNSKDMLLSRYILQSVTGKLTISNLNHTQDDGYFYCVAANAAGKVRSQRLVIQVACEWPAVLSFIWACIHVKCVICLVICNFKLQSCFLHVYQYHICDVCQRLIKSEFLRQYNFLQLLTVHAAKSQNKIWMFFMQGCVKLNIWRSYYC